MPMVQGAIQAMNKEWEALIASGMFGHLYE